MNIVMKRIDEVIPYENNPRNNDDAVQYVANSIKEFGFKVPVIIDADNVIIAGHTRLKASKLLGLKEVPCIIADDLTEDQIKAFRLADNKVSEIATWDLDKLNLELYDIEMDMSDFGFLETDIAETIDDKYPDGIKGGLSIKYIVPPFSILDGRKGEWLDRKRWWRELIGDDGTSRGETAQTFKTGLANSFSTTSVLDPVLSEIVLTWFMPDNGKKVFDCFAGDTVFGYVAGTQGFEFTGIELRQEQVDFNQSRVEGLNATYICDDGRNVCTHIAPESQDMFLAVRLIMI